MRQGSCICSSPPSPMSFPLTNYAPGLFAPTANTYGNLFLSQSVTTTNFNGMPMVGVFAGFGTFSGGAYDVALGLMLDFVNRFPGGLVVVDEDFSPSGQGAAYLRQCFSTISPLLSSDQATAPVVVTDVRTTPTVYAGPFMVIRTTTPVLPDPAWSLAWATAISYSRITQNTPWGMAGLEAVCAFTDWDMSPPVFIYNTTTPPPFSLTDLYNRMQGNSVTTVQLVQRVQFYESGASPPRPGLTRQINPILAGYALLFDPRI